MHDSCGPSANRRKSLSQCVEKQVQRRFSDINHNQQSVGTKAVIRDVYLKTSPHWESQIATQHSSSSSSGYERPYSYHCLQYYHQSRSSASENEAELKAIEWIPELDEIEVETKSTEIRNRKSLNLNKNTANRNSVTSWKHLCGRCEKPVYFAEKVFSLPVPWHISCLYCYVCHKKLAPGIHAVKNGLPICQYPCLAASFSTLK
ncbi:cysteine-rich protein 2-like protein [Leptotrombidium deliense]|uniref:Cysteine-rich protein 2-like protein n=1 Tax=Leptotrombidium deliense TaxID=299467 RepID=A0A443SEC9_9ACAR|nr:cysteine-rich protein 2-like protein [Leptotrombidium deliense]